jgi:hypothetical protein
MALLRYWSDTQQAWLFVGGALLGVEQGYVPMAGGTISGDLAVNLDNHPWSVMIIAAGRLSATGITTTAGGVFDGNILLTPGRTVTFGGARVQNVGDPVAADSAATKGYTDATFVRSAVRTEPALSQGWAGGGGGYGPPSYWLSGNSRRVLLGGVVRAVGPMTPSRSAAALFTLDGGCRPVTPVTAMAVGSSKGVFTVEVGLDGAVRLTHGPSIPDGGWVSLDGCMFPII